MPARVLLVAIDGASATMVDGLMAQGALPHLARPRAAGGAAPLIAPAGISDDGLWASFHYGGGLGEHGRYDYIRRLPDGRPGMAHTDEADLRTWWERNPDLRVALFDMPKSRAPRPLNGLHLADWLVHGRYFAEPMSHPPALAGEVVARFGPAPPSRCDYEQDDMTDAGIAEMVANLRLSTARKRAAGLHYLASDDWDVFAIGFKEAHCAGHAFWELAEAGRPARDAGSRDGPGDPLRVVLADIDEAIGALAAVAGPQAAVAVFTTTDMQANGTLHHLAPAIVERLNAACGEPAWRRLAAAWFGRRRRRPGRRIELLRYNENCTALRVNLPEGAARRAVLDRMEALLSRLADVESGQPAVAAIDRPSRDCPGPRAAMLPDMLLHVTPGLMPRAVASPELGRFEAEPPLLRSGNHRAGGSIIASGPCLDLAAIGGMEDIGAAVAAAARRHAARET